MPCHASRLAAEPTVYWLMGTSLSKTCSSLEDESVFLACNLDKMGVERCPKDGWRPEYPANSIRATPVVPRRHGRSLLDQAGRLLAWP